MRVPSEDTADAGVGVVSGLYCATNCFDGGYCGGGGSGDCDVDWCSKLIGVLLSINQSAVCA